MIIIACKNEIGNNYGKLTVIERGPNTKDGKAQWKCLCECGNEVIVTGKNLRSGNTKSCGCYKKDNPPRQKDLSGKKFGKLLVIEPYSSNKRGVIWKCLCDCGTICYKVSTDLIHGNTKSCGCYKKELHSTMNDLTNQKFGELTALFSNSIANDGQRMWHCKCSCGSEIEVRAGALRSGKTKSCGCKTSKGNLELKNLLTEKGIKFKQEFTFENLKYISKLKFDFALFEKDTLKCLIEYNGRQHYEPIDFFGGEKSFIEQQKRDRLKKEYCINNNIPLFIIKFDENIEERLEEILNELFS